MAVSLSSTLAAHQLLPARKPILTVTATAKRASVELLRWTRYYTGGEADTWTACCITAAGTLLRARIDASGNVLISRVISPGAGSTYSSWTSNAWAALASASVALAAKTGEIAITFPRTGSLIVERRSVDDGVTWSAAVTIATEASAVERVALAYNEPASGNLRACWTIAGAPTNVRTSLYSATGWSAAATWTNTAAVATVTSLAMAFDGADFSLIVTGTVVTTLDKRVWACLLGDGGILAVGTWSALLDNVAEADAASTSSFLCTGNGIAHIGSDPHAFFTHKETGNLPYSRARYSHPARQTGVLGRWLQPQPHEAATAFGLSAWATTTAVWAATANGVWFASLPSGNDLSARVLSCRYKVTPTSTSLQLELANHDGALNALPNATYAATLVGGSILVQPGYKSGAAGAPEYGVGPAFTIDAIDYVHDAAAGRATVLITASGPWERAARWHAPQAYQFAALAATRENIFLRIAAKIGYPTVSQGSPRAPSATWTSNLPSFAISPGESAQSALTRLLEPTSDHIRPDASEFRCLGNLVGDASSGTYGASGQHPIARLTARSTPPPANWLRLQGTAAYAEGDNLASVYAHGARLRQLRNLDAGAGQVGSWSAAALRRDTMAQEKGTLVAPFDCARQLLDVVTVTDSALGLAGQTFRVTALQLDYARGPSPKARYDITLTLGGL